MQQQQQQHDAEASTEPLTAAAPAPPASPPELLARFRVNQHDTLAVFRAVSTEDFADVAGLLPADTALPAADKMTYLLARLEVRQHKKYSPFFITLHYLVQCEEATSAPCHF
jgi:hypothetical protein